jgi:hypothetical protein
MAIEDAAILHRCIVDAADTEAAFRRHVAQLPQVVEVQRISIANTWMHGPTEVDWFFTAMPRSTPRPDPGAANAATADAIRPDPMKIRDLVGYGETPPCAMPSTSSTRKGRRVGRSFCRSVCTTG